MSKRTEVSVMQVLLLQVQFELTRAVADLAAAAEATMQADRQEKAADARCEVAAVQMRTASVRARIDPALLQGLRHIYRVERAGLNAARARLNTARNQEDEARGVVADLRSRERTFEEALKLQRNKQRQAQQAADVARADELWLQRYGAQLR